VRSIAIVIALGGIAWSQPDSETASYRIRKTDTLDLIAAEFYGDRGHQLLIVEENRLQKAHGLVPGDRLRIPVTREITTVKGDTFESVAAAQLGDARRAQLLADFNGATGDPTAVLATGTVIVVPIHVTHTAASSESIAQVAAAFLGDAKQADLLRRYNFTDKTQLDKGESIVVPVVNVRVRPTKLAAPDAEAKQRAAAQRKATADAAIALPRARAAWLAGDFAGVKTAFENLDLQYLDSATAAEAWMLLGKALLADDDVDRAVESFTAVLARRPHQVLSAYADSPKVIAAWKRAGGHVAGE